MELMRYRSDDGVKVAFVKPGRLKLALIEMDSAGIRVRRVPRSEERYCSPLAYPAKKAARRFLKAGKAFGISKSARVLLKEVLA